MQKKKFNVQVNHYNFFVVHKIKRTKQSLTKSKYRSQAQNIERLFILVLSVIPEAAQSLVNSLRTLVFPTAHCCYRSEHFKVAKRERGA